MADHLVTVLGGLQAVADVTFYRGNRWDTEEDDAEVEMYWAKRDGSKGAPFSDKMYARLDKRDPFWHANVIEQVCDAIAYEQYAEEEGILLT